MEVEAGGGEVADLGGANTAVDAMQMAAVGVALDATSVGTKLLRDVDVAAESIPADATPTAVSEGADADGIKAAAHTSTSDKMHPEVVARLKMVTSISIEIYAMHNNLFIFMDKMGLSFFDFMWYCV
ncbi:unnamed protein product [Urochloa humidicola]